jgi:hypothetical protein
VTLTAVDYFEDIVIGRVYETPGLTLTEAHRTQFLGLGGDPPEPADDRQIPALLPLCLSSGLGFRVGPPLAVLAFMGFEWEFRLPLFIGDTVRSRSSTAAKRSLREGGVIVETREILNQGGAVAQRGRLTLLVAKRPAERA